MSQHQVGDDITGYWEKRYQEWAGAPIPDWGVYDVKDDWFDPGADFKRMEAKALP